MNKELILKKMMKWNLEITESEVRASNGKICVIVALPHMIKNGKLEYASNVEEYVAHQIENTYIYLLKQEAVRFHQMLEFEKNRSWWDKLFGRKENPYFDDDVNAFFVKGE